MTEAIFDYGNGRTARRWARRKLLLAGTLLLLLVGAILFFRYGNSSVGRRLLLAAGQAAMQSGSFEAALDYYMRAEAQGELPIETLFDCAKAALHLGRATDAERYVRRLLARDPGHLAANDLLCGLLRIGWRNWELRPHALEMMRNDAFSLANLVALTTADPAVNRGSPAENGLEMFIMQQATGEREVAVRLGEARNFMRHNQYDQALPLLKWILHEQPDLLDAQAQLGALLLATDAISELRAWHRRLPQNASQHPEIWMVRGGWAEAEDDRRGAARCYWEALRRHPDHQSATYRLSQLLTGLGRPAEAAEFAARASELAKVQEAAFVGTGVPGNIQQLAERLEALGRPWESLGWSQVTLQRDPRGDVAWAQQRVARLRQSIARDSPLLVDSFNLAMKIDLSDCPEPDWRGLQGKAGEARTARFVAGPFAFVDSAKAAGISFSYFNSADPRRAYMFEFSGGGVGVLDYDADGWPDLYLTQGCRWPVDPAQREFQDRLFRNLGNGRFIDVTEQAGLLGTGFGQGVSVGDINNDGLPDLYVANIGPNQLFRNNGDGTFTEISSAGGIQGSEWTVSTLIADLNGDANPELYDVNYLGGPIVFTEVCLRDGKPIQCFPNQFPGEFDKVYQNLGDDRFANVSESAGIVVPDGKGMGIVAADFDGSGRLSLFIANDTAPNFFFVNQTAFPGGELRFAERALLAGVAFGETGKTASCMGVAIADINDDARLDLFVTNFEGEANYLFVQGSDQGSDIVFEDHIRQSLLYGPGFPMEGWGAQFLDGNLDGRLDLVVANGHLDDYPHSTGVNRMPVQFFHNLGEGKFAEVPANQLGSYFEKRYLGRAVACLDWNRDGAPDFCVTNVDSPFALLTNQTPNRGNYLVVHLRGVHSARDAIGARVTLRAGSQSWSRQLVAGDGYSASNQRQLTFGLGPASQLDELTIRWPSGHEQTFHGMEVNHEWLFVEGRPAAVRLD